MCRIYVTAWKREKTPDVMQKVTQSSCFPTERSCLLLMVIFFDSVLLRQIRTWSGRLWTSRHQYMPSEVSTASAWVRT
jgi:hypothetical protein